MNYRNIFKSRDTRLKILKMLRFIPDSLMLKLQYRIKLGKKLNLKNPKRYTEKLQWYKLNYRDPLMAKCADKYAVRNYIESQGLENILNPLYGVYDRAEDIDFDALPAKFVMKDTLGGGSNGVVVCLDKDKANRTELFETAKKWIDKGIEKVNPGREWVYCQTPHRIVIEKYIESESPDGLVDWKFFCFNGKVEFVYWLGNRVMGKSVQCGIFDSSFLPMNVYRTDEERLMHEVEKPDNFDDMVKIAEMLAKQFPHVRVDLYNEQNRIVFGELTFFPGSGYMKFVPDEFDIMIGKKFVLPKPRFYTNRSVSNSKRKTLGIIGGMGPMATADIFMKIISLTDASNDAEHIHIIIDDYPQIPDRTEAIRDGNKIPVLYIQDSIKRLEKAGADVLIMPCCTAHYFYNELSRKCSVALINMVAITAKVLNDRNIKRAGLLATNGTIESNVFEKEFLKYNINLIKPSEKGQKAIMNVIYDQIKSGKSICLDGILEEMEQMQKKGIEVFILGCTELPLAFANISCKYMLVDPTDILAIEAIKSVGYRVKKQDVLLTNNIFLSV